VARAILVVAAIAWLAAGIVALGIALYGADALERALPPLAIDTDALRGAITAVAVALVGVAAVHGVILAGLRGSRRWAWTAGILGGAVMAMLFVAFAVAAVTSAIAEPANAASLALGAVGAVVAAIGYGAVVIRLLAEVRSGVAG
jgi:hypothetical protein